MKDNMLIYFYTFFLLKLNFRRKKEHYKERRNYVSYFIGN